eukprot:8520274-Pyramimonas_sp.AAC.1
MELSFTFFSFGALVCPRSFSGSGSGWARTGFRPCSFENRIAHETQNHDHHHHAEETLHERAERHADHNPRAVGPLELHQGRLDLVLVGLHLAGCRPRQRCHRRHGLGTHLRSGCGKTHGLLLSVLGRLLLSGLKLLVELQADRTRPQSIGQ